MPDEIFGELCYNRNRREGVEVQRGDSSLTMWRIEMVLSKGLLVYVYNTTLAGAGEVVPTTDLSGALLRIKAAFTDAFHDEDGFQKLELTIDRAIEAASSVASRSGVVETPELVEKVASWKAKLEKAHKMVSALCNGEQRWVLPVPANHDTDPDLVIGAGLLAGDEAVAAIRAMLSSAPSATGEIREIPDNIRLPLHSLQADIAYMFGRVAADGSVSNIMTTSAKERLSQIETAVLGLLNSAPAPEPDGRERDAVHEALKTVRLALNDWVVSYAPDQCGGDSVKETNARLYEYGTLWYISNALNAADTIAAALSPSPARVEERGK